MEGHKDMDLGEEYASALQLMDAADRLRRTWGVMHHPEAELRRGDMMLINRLLGREQQGQAPPTLGQLARILHQTPPGITQKVNALEQQGLVLRITDPDDRRVACVQLTDKGRQLGRQSMHTFLQGMEQALDVLGKGKSGQLVELMEQLCDAIEAVAPRPAEEKRSKGVEGCC